MRGTARLSFARRHATGLTLASFFVCAAGLGVAPLPERYQPVRLESADELQAATARVFKKPRLTLAKLEAPPPSAGGSDDDGEAEVQLATSEEDEPAAPEEPAPEVLLAAIPAPEPASEPVASKPPRRREAEKPTKRVTAWRRLATRLGASASKVENPCVRFDEKGCARTALDPFFASLDAVDQGEDGSHATVVALGNSLIASDHVTDVVRARLVRRFGDGGRGFLLPDRLSKAAGRRVRTGLGTPGWEIHTFAQKPPERSEFGFSGSMHESSEAGDRIVWQLKGATRGRLFFLDHPGNPGFRLEVDGKPLLEVPSERPATAEDRLLDLELEKGAKTLRLVAEGPGAVLYGVALAKERPGVVWDTIGVPASDASLYASTDEGLFRRQLAAREPSLVVVMIGGNEIRSLAYGWSSLEEIREAYGTLLQRVKDAAPDAACLAVSPIDAAKATAGGAELSTRAEVHEVVALERELALEKGCAFFNLFEAMGGDGSLERFHRQGLVNDDLVHPKGAGGDVLGNVFADALLASYRETPQPRDEVRARRRLVRPELLALELPRRPGAMLGAAPEPPLARFFERLSALEAGQGGRVGIGLVGGSHVAAERLPGRVRERLQDRFGDAGRGLFAAGPRSARLEATGVVRRLSGPHELHDGRQVTLGGAMSIYGSKVRLLPGGRFEARLCEGCSDSRFAPRGALKLAWLYTPDMGAADVFVNDVQVGSLSASERRMDSDVQVLTIPVRGRQHTVSVQAKTGDDGAPAGPVHLFSVAADLERRGVFVDAVGVAGTTAMTPQRWRQDLLAEQAHERRWDLVALAWGANEAGLAGLDEATYRFHLTRTVETFLEASPDASCLLLGPSERLMDGGRAPSHELVEAVQREVAGAFGCAFFSLSKAMGGEGGMARWQAEGLATDDGVHLTEAGYERLADVLLHDVLALYAYELLRREQAELERLEVAKGQRAAPAAPPPEERTAPPGPAASGTSGRRG